ncbi:MAG: TetR/AcrR family transcriptional regulator [Spirochaetes bacterium]|nr:TetR/AcrR family transcriptional regulator [Spirochaetota bacterium]
MKADERKKLILEHAKRLFSRKGYYDTQISDIVNEAKIARGTVYQYFKNKDDIFITLIKNFYQDWEANISIEMHKIDMSKINPVDYMSFRVKNTLQLLASDPDLCNIVLRMGIGLSGELETSIKRFEKKIHNLIVNDLKLGIRNHHVRRDLNIDMTSHLITGALLRTALAFFGNRRNRKDGNDIEKMTREIIAIFAPAIFIKK